MGKSRSVLKRQRQSLKRAARNRETKSRVKTFLRAAREWPEDVEEAKKRVGLAVRELDRAKERGILKRNTVARKKSQLMKRLAELLAKTAQG